MTEASDGGTIVAWVSCWLVPLRVLGIPTVSE
jgi:hypothetical protein